MGNQLCYIARAQSQYLRASSGLRPHRRGHSKSEGYPTAAGAQGIELRVIPTMGLFYCLRRTPLVSKRAYLSLRGRKAVRLTDSPAQADLGLGTATNRLSTVEATGPRYGHLEEERPWKRTLDAGRSSDGESVPAIMQVATT